MPSRGYAHPDAAGGCERYERVGDVGILLVASPVPLLGGGVSLVASPVTLLGGRVSHPAGRVSLPAGRVSLLRSRVSLPAGRVSLLRKREPAFLTTGFARTIPTH